MRQQYSNPHNVRRSVLVTPRPYEGPVITREEIDEIEEEKRERNSKVHWRMKYFSRGHIENAHYYLRCSQIPRGWRRSRFRRTHGLLRKTPAKVLKTIKDFNLK